MGDAIILTLDERTKRGKKVKALREQEIVPGVIYGQGFDPIMVQAEYNTIDKVVRSAGKHSPIEVKVKNETKIALIKDVDRDPVKARLRHVSFHAVSKDEIVTAEVPIVLIGEGESAAEKAGLIVLQAIEVIEVKAKPANLPDALEVPIVSLATVQDKLTLNDIALPRGVVFADADIDRELVVANVYEPAALEAANEAAAGESTLETQPETEQSTDASAGEGETGDKKA